MKETLNVIASENPAAAKKSKSLLIKHVVDQGSNLISLTYYSQYLTLCQLVQQLMTVGAVN